MRKKLMSFISSVVLGLAGLLLVGEAQSQPPQTRAEFEAALSQYEARMDRLHAELNATLPQVGPLTDYQLRLLSQIEAPMPYELATSSLNCFTGGSHSSLVTQLDRNHEVRERGEKAHTFQASSGWILRDPTVDGTGLHEINFKGYTSQDQETAHADIKDKLNVGDSTTAIGLRGSGRITVTCDGPNGATQTRGFGWTLFRDCPHSSH